MIQLIFRRIILLPLDNLLKLKHTVDALFGNGVSKYVPKNIEVSYSRRTGRMKSVYHRANLLCTLRIDGGLAITPYFAQMLLKSKKFQDNCLGVSKDAAPFVMDGKSVFCKHVSWCGKNVKIAGDTPVLHEDEVIAVGKAVLSSEMILSMRRGVAVKVRDSLKRHSRQ